MYTIIEKCSVKHLKNIFIYMYVGEHVFTTMVCIGAIGQRALVHSVLPLT